jgi:hypothetical protein
MPIHQLLVKNKVSVLFQGHDHLYAREELDGLVYQTVPMPSDSSYTLGMIANADAFGGIKMAGSGHIRITVSPEKATVDFVSALLPKDETSQKKNGSILYSYTVLPSGNTTLAPLLSGKPDGPTLSIHPNPFSFFTNIEFTLAKGSKTEMLVTDLSGRNIDTIDAGWLPSGPHKVRWTVGDLKGRQLKRGLYICTVKTEEGTSSAKMIFSWSN